MSAPARFPSTPTFTGFNEPRRIEADVLDLEVEGRLPEELEGTFYRCGPDPRYPPRLGDDINLNGDGMVMMFRFSGGHVDFRSRYVRTEKFRLEQAARRALFGAYRNPFTDDPQIRERTLANPGMRTTANTSVAFHAGRLYALKEDGLPHELDADTLETRGAWDYCGRMASLTSTAHPKIDPSTGEMFSHGYEARGLATRDIALHVVSSDGKLLREEMFLAPFVGMMHDWAVTSRHLLFPLMPTTADLERLRRGGPHWVFEPDRATEIGIMRRDASTETLAWHRAPPCGVGHVLNAFSDGERVHVDIFVSERSQFPFIASTDGRPFSREAGTPRLARWSFDASRPAAAPQSQRLHADFMEMPAIDPRYAMHPYRHGFCTVVDPTRPLDAAGTIGVGWNTLVHLDLATGALERYWVGERSVCQEPCFVPRTPAAPEGEGFVLSQITRFEGEWRTEIIVLDAQRLPEGPLARVRVPFRLRPAVHGIWVPSRRDLLPNRRTT
jgi:carotenoid cleavage dioxygenase-like enzyme